MNDTISATLRESNFPALVGRLNVLFHCRYISAEWYVPYVIRKGFVSQFLKMHIRPL